MSANEPIFAVYKNHHKTTLFRDCSQRKEAAGWEEMEGINLERDVIIPYTDLKLLLSNDALLGPVRVVFPVVRQYPELVS